MYEISLKLYPLLILLLLFSHVFRSSFLWRFVILFLNSIKYPLLKRFCGRDTEPFLCWIFHLFRIHSHQYQTTVGNFTDLFFFDFIHVRFVDEWTFSYNLYSLQYCWNNDTEKRIKTCRSLRFTMTEMCNTHLGLWYCRFRDRLFS